MMATVIFEKTSYADITHKFDAGTPKSVGGLACAWSLYYMYAIGIVDISA